MAVLKFSARADAAGFIHLDIPVGAGGSYDLQVVVSPNRDEMTPSDRGWPPGYFERTAGAIQDPTFERGDQGEYEAREPFE